MDSAETGLDIVSRININLTTIRRVLPVLAAVSALPPGLEANANNVNSLLGNCGNLRLLLDAQRPLTTTGQKNDHALYDATERVVKILARCFKSCENGTVDHEKLASVDHDAAMDLTYIDAGTVDIVRDLRNQLESIKQTDSANLGTETIAPPLRENQTAIRKTLYELLAAQPSSCSSLHTAMIRLVSGQHDAQNDLSILVSVCDSAKKDTHCGWHEIRCSIDHGGAVGEHSAELCTHFAGRQWHRYTPQWRFNRQRIWQVERQRTCDSSPTIQSLEDLFDPKNRKKFKLAHRKLLQCAVAQALYHFCGTPWIGFPWTSSSLVFRCSDIQKGPFLHSYAQTPLWQMEARGMETDSSPDEEFMLHFTALLLQLERPDMLHDLKFSPEDLGDVERMDEALNDWIHDMREDDLKKWFVDVLDTCVDFENRRKSVPDPRMIVRDRIWEPLRAELISSFPNIAKEVDISLTEEENLWWPKDKPQVPAPVLNPGVRLKCSSEPRTFDNSGHTHSYSSLVANGSGPQVNGAFYGTQINYYGVRQHLDKLSSIDEDGFVV